MLRVLSIVGALALVVSVAAQAKEEKEHPCMKIKAACEAAGFKKGDHKDGKGLYKDCLQKIKAGQSVPGVSVTAEDMSACSANVEKRKEKKAANAGKVGPGKSAPAPHP
ncbi:MAG: hypothetical protein ACXWQO_17625 [Bdellovibrionota bacterium]